MKIPRLPTSVCLGAGYRIKVVLVLPSELAVENDEEDQPQHARSPGSWDPDEMLIQIDSRKSLTEQWAIFRHDLLHALHDVIWMESQHGGPP